MTSRIMLEKKRGYKYYFVRCPLKYESMADCRGYVAEHRLLMAIYNGRTLKRNEFVEHKDKNTLNNDISNLILRRFKHEIH
jgi:hypothetical protein